MDVLPTAFRICAYVVCVRRIEKRRCPACTPFDRPREMTIGNTPVDIGCQLKLDSVFPRTLWLVNGHRVRRCTDTQSARAITRSIRIAFIDNFGFALHPRSAE